MSTQNRVLSDPEGDEKMNKRRNKHKERKKETERNSTDKIREEN